RAGDFLYSDLEMETMLRDIESCAAAGCDGVALGVLDADGNVDMPRCRALIAAAGGMGVTFHRAFDLVRDPSSALDDVLALGCERVLTSGGEVAAMDGAQRIKALLLQAGSRLAVMPGAGISAGNIAGLAARTGANEFHASAKQPRDSRMQHRHARLDDMQQGELRS